MGNVYLFLGFCEIHYIFVVIIKEKKVGFYYILIRNLKQLKGVDLFNNKFFF
jgi:hypothetical protein